MAIPHNNLRAVRKELNLTQKQAATCCGVTETAYQRWESGSRRTPANAEVKLKANAPGFRPPLSAGFEDVKLVKAVSKALPPFAPTAGPLVDPLDSAARCIALIKMIRDALRDGNLQ